MYAKTSRGLSEILLKYTKDHFAKSVERHQVIKNKTNLIMQRAFEIVNEMPEFNVIQTGWSQRVRISKTLIHLDILGIIAPVKEGSVFGNRRTLAFFDVLPYRDPRDIAQDLPTLLKLHILASQNPGVLTPAKAFLFGLGKAHTIMEADPLPKDYLEMVRQQVLLMEQGINFPLARCRFSCPFKEVCGVKLKNSTVIHKWK